MFKAMLYALSDYVSNIFYREVAVFTILFLNDVPLTSC